MTSNAVPANTQATLTQASTESFTNSEIGDMADTFNCRVCGENSKTYPFQADEDQICFPCHLKEKTPTRKAGRPRDPNAKSVQQIALRPADWEYAALWAIDSYNVADNASTRMERMISRLRSMAPKGPDAFGFERDPAKPPTPRTTPAVAREAAHRGISKAELINEMYAIYKAQKGKEE